MSIKYACPKCGDVVYLTEEDIWWLESALFRCDSCKRESLYKEEYI